MSTPIWKPNVTVAAIIERAGSFLLVEEHTKDGIRFNQPAGHLDPGETIPVACARETLEETAWQFTPRALVGVYLMPIISTDITYLRFAFSGELGLFDAQRTLDKGIIRAVWMTPEEARATSDRHRSPLVMRCIDDYLAGQHFPMDLIAHYPPQP